MFTFTPLLGAQSSASKASQSILQLEGGIKILVDVGWDDTFDPLDLQELEKHVPTISLILLTHATPAHIGAFAHCCKTFPSFTKIPVYATSPVIALGRTLLQDLYASSPLAATFLPESPILESGATTSAASAAASVVEGDESPEAAHAGRILLQPPTAEDIARYFSLIHPLKYSQPHQPLRSPWSPPLDGLTLTAYNAGHTVGGTIWHIQHGMESIVYAVDWNQARESVVAGAAWFGGSGASGTEVIEQLRKPTALVCSTRGGEKFALPGGRKKRDDLLLDMIRSTVAKGGTVLIPTDTSARVLELVYALEHAWRDAAGTGQGDDVLRTAGLYMAGKKANTTMRLARSMLEWMDENIVREFEAAEGVDATTGQAQSNNDGPRSGGQNKTEGRGVGPFTFKHLKIIEKRKRLEKILTDQTPKVILASDTSLDWGFAKESLRLVADGANNLLLLTEPLHKEKVSSNHRENRHRKTLGGMIWEWYEERKDGVALEKAADGEMLEQVHSGGRELSWSEVRRAPLDAGEQMLYQQYLATKRELEDTTQTGGQENTDPAADVLDDQSSSSSEDSETEQQGRVLTLSTTLAHGNRSKLGLRDEDLGVNILLRRKNVYDYDVRGKKGRERMFPYVAPRKRGDEYGEFIRPEEYLRAEEREEADMQQRRTDSQMRLGQKRRWDESGPNGRRLSSSGGKRHQGQGEASKKDISTADELSVMEDGEAADAAASSDDEPEGQAFEGPAKVVFEKASLTIKARLAFVDFTGLHDKRSLEMLIPLIQPRKLILVGGMKQETTALADECQKLLAAKVDVDVPASADSAVIFTPVNGETVDASVDTNAWMVKLSNHLFRRLKWQHVRSLGVVTLTGQLRGPESQPQPATAEQDQEGPHKKQKVLPQEETNPATDSEAESTKQQQQQPPPPPPPTDKSDIYPLLDVLPANMAAGTRSMTRPLHVGDLRLADLRKLMQGAGHTAEFRGEGTLLIDGMVAVRKSATGRIEIEASAQSAAMVPGRKGAGSFLAVKQKIYEGLAVVSGS
ncbi:cleavage polyadenylation factor subunit CFT2 [Aspergillus brunneoviolaceus CBS 621.78]|uniref:mRNA cleavage and polyadenylation factor II complex, subunit CFT2 n=1 Tax=Aspergillus brunneoviolaceus CBS 621.78 TaxID=1450534 RepID=A0ACD1G3Q3_9EURO|nr:mRNA cleavage and polyadenylation factor II complex, subunit CFT2 [Aspergillus brunneoviolaceus CBS 621.78]RAH43771.1 mRNA cleavage and polyadenylation factor II complex, subunit CFT2 [Aspergillus brunneoviolaceus CBS 621.78]